MVVALQKSLNTVAVWLSIKIGEAHWPQGQPYHLGRIAQLGREKIVENARKMGVGIKLAPRLKHERAHVRLRMRNNQIRLDKNQVAIGDDVDVDQRN
jgi:hypothetical protein